jgi:hypothetical protein
LPATLAIGISFCLDWLASSSFIRDSLDSSSVSKSTNTVDNQSSDLPYPSNNY